MARKKGSKNKSKLHPADRPELLEKQIELNELEHKKELVGEPYKLTLKSLGRVYKSEGATLKEALAGIKVMGNAKAVSVLIVEKGDRRIEKVIYPLMAHRYFSNGGPTMKTYALNKITELIPF